MPRHRAAQRSLAMRAERCPRPHAGQARTHGTHARTSHSHGHSGRASGSACTGWQSLAGRGPRRGVAGGAPACGGGRQGRCARMRRRVGLLAAGRGEGVDKGGRPCVEPSAGPSSHGVARQEGKVERDAVAWGGRKRTRAVGEGRESAPYARPQRRRQPPQRSDRHLRCQGPHPLPGQVAAQQRAPGGWLRSHRTETPPARAARHQQVRRDASAAPRDN